MTRLLMASTCLAVGLLTAMVFSLFSYFAFFPSRLHLTASSDLFGIALVGGLYTAGLPLLTLWILGLRRFLSPSAAALVSAVWLLSIVLWRSLKPYNYFGVFPTWVLYRDFVQPLPTALAAGLVFGLVARRVSSNPSLQRTGFAGR